MDRYKYPRTRHLPWSCGVSSDDLRSYNLSNFEGKEVVVTEKMDGENTTMYRDGIHARSLDSSHHPSRNWVKALHGRIGWRTPEGWRICGENLYARHSIAYDQLPSFFMVFSIWASNNMCLSWDDTVAWAKMTDLVTVPEIERGIFNGDRLQSLIFDTNKIEGYVVRLASSFSYGDFDRSVAKWVRESHVQTDEHWMHKAVVPNQMG